MKPAMTHQALLEIVERSADASFTQLETVSEQKLGIQVSVYYGRAIQALQRAEFDAAALGSVRLLLDDAQSDELSVLEKAPALQALQALEDYKRDRAEVRL